jgi:hypothetical protein
MKWPYFLLPLLLGISTAVKAECGGAADGVYVIGNSLSSDTLPFALENDPEAHLFCAKSLDYIFNNPDGHCGENSTPWPEVLTPPAETYDYISFQPYPAASSTQQQDSDHITYWLGTQPTCTVGVIHPSWPSHTSWEATLHEANPNNTYTNRSKAYAYDLLEKLRSRKPARSFALTRSNEMLDHIFHDPTAPFAFVDLFRNTGHMSLGLGRYLQHNALRQAMGQPTGVSPNSTELDPAIRSYLDAVIALYPGEGFG